MNKELNDSCLCLQSIEHCKRFEPIAKKLGIEPDGIIDNSTGKVIEPIVLKYFYKGGVKQQGYCIYYDDPGVKIEEAWIVNPSAGDYTLTYRQDKLELPLPDWVWDRSMTSSKLEQIIKYPKDCVFFDHISRSRDNVLFLRGEPKRIAAVELVELLEDYQDSIDLAEVEARANDEVISSEELKEGLKKEGLL